MTRIVKQFQIRCAANGDIIDDFDTLQEAKIQLALFDETDKFDGNYEAGFYEIYDSLNQEIID